MEMMRVMLFVSMMMAVFVKSSNAADVCPNRFSCHKTEIKYRSFEKMTGTFFNSTRVIESTSITNPTACIQRCTSKANCQSMNHYLNASTSQMMCDLIDANKWSNKKDIIERSHSTHYFIHSPCVSNPCQHGGTCIPVYETGTYTCKCLPNNQTVWLTGKHCEKLTISEGTANIFYRFDDQKPFKDSRSTSGHSMSIHGSAKVIQVPDWKSPVMFIPAASGRHISSSSYSSQCIVLPENCGTGLSVSFWFKILETTQRKFKTTHECKNKQIYPIESVSINTYRGFYVRFIGCPTSAFKVRLRFQTSYYKLEWGTAHNKTLHRQWSHFLFTFKSSDGIILYFNGVEVARAPRSTSAASETSHGSQIHLGSKNTGFEMYMDRVAAWYLKLEAADVQKVYKTGLKESVRKVTPEKK